MSRWGQAADEDSGLLVMPSRGTSSISLLPTNSHSSSSGSGLALPSAFHSASRRFPPVNVQQKLREQEENLEEPAVEDERRALSPEEQEALMELLSQDLNLNLEELSSLSSLEQGGMVPSGSRAEQEVRRLLTKVAELVRVPNAFAQDEDERDENDIVEAERFIATLPRFLALAKALADLLPPLSPPDAAAYLFTFSALSTSPCTSFSNPLADAVCISLRPRQAHLAHLLKTTLPPMFAQHPRLSANSARPLARPRGGDRAILDWYEDHPAPLPSLAPVLGFIFVHLSENAIPSLFPFILPPLLSFIDHYSPSTKSLGQQLLLILLPKLPPSLLKSTGTDKLLLQASPELKTSLPLLQHLHAPESRELFDSLAPLVTSPPISDPNLIPLLPPALVIRFLPLFVPIALDPPNLDVVDFLWDKVPAHRKGRWRPTFVAGLAKGWCETKVGNRTKEGEKWKALMGKLVDGAEGAEWREKLEKLDGEVFDELLPEPLMTANRLPTRLPSV